MKMHPFFDEPTPEAISKLRRLNLIGLAGVALVVGLVIYAFYNAGQFQGKLWAPFLEPALWMTIARGLGATLRAVVLCLVLSVVFGIIITILRTLGWKWLQRLLAAWVEIFRAVPSLLIILFFFFAYSPQFARLGMWLESVLGYEASLLLGADQMQTLGPLVIAVVLYHSSLFAEVFRAGLQALPRGQEEAGLALGLTRWQVIRSITLPQAITIMQPALISETVRTTKATALGYVIGYMELLRTGQIVAAAFHNVIPMSMVLVAIYTAICWPLSRLETFTRRRNQQRLAAGTATTPHL
jgi:glutamate transport system permease protein